MRSDAGSVSSKEPCKPYVTLLHTLKDIDKFVFLTIKCYTTAIIRENDMYYVFDPHSSNIDGMIATDGKALLKSHSNFENLIQFLEKFSSSLGDTENECIPFEATHVDIVTCTNESDDFEGFSDMSDKEHACMLQIIKDNLEHNLKKIEEHIDPIVRSEMELFYFECEDMDTAEVFDDVGMDLDIGAEITVPVSEEECREPENGDSKFESGYVIEMGHDFHGKCH